METNQTRVVLQFVEYKVEHKKWEIRYLFLKENPS